MGASSAIILYIIMEALTTFILYTAIICIISAAAYFVIKSAVKAALKEFEDEKRC